MVIPIDLAPGAAPSIGVHDPLPPHPAPLPPSQLPWVPGTLPAGALVDRVDPSRAMAAACLVRAAALGTRPPSACGTAMRAAAAAVTLLAGLLGLRSALLGLRGT